MNRAAKNLTAFVFLLLAPLAAMAEEGTIRGEPIIKDDFERCTPRTKS
jgi:hypothetical protein